MTDYPVFNFSQPVIKTIPIEELACISLNEWVVNMGLTIVISYVLICWLSWWYFQHGYKKFSYNNKFMGNCRKKENRIYWDMWIRHKLLKVSVGYIALVVYLTMF